MCWIIERANDSKESYTICPSCMTMQICHTYCGKIDGMLLAPHLFGCSRHCVFKRLPKCTCNKCR